jgi:hypothetical protein
LIPSDASVASEQHVDPKPHGLRSLFNISCKVWQATPR